MVKWFIYQKEVVKGPYNHDEMSQMIQSLGDDKKQTLVWTRGQAEWTSASNWTGYVATKAPPAPPKTSSKKSPPPAPKNTAKTAPSEPPVNLDETVKFTPKNKKTSDSNNTNQKFKVQYDFIEQKDMTQDELMTFVQKVEDPSKILVFDSNEQLWKEIYTFDNILKNTGITRRQSQRVPILAQFNGQTSKQDKIQNRIISISSGGVGFTDCFNLKLGETIQGQISSPHFYSPITITAEVTYSGLDGYVGLKFTSINDEGSAMIADYIKRFGKEHLN